MITSVFHMVYRLLEGRIYCLHGLNGPNNLFLGGQLPGDYASCRISLIALVGSTSWFSRTSISCTNGTHASADVQMTIRLIDAYFHRAQGTPIPGNIEAFFRPKPSRGTKSESQTEVTDAECRDKVNQVSHFSDDELLRTVMNWRQILVSLVVTLKLTGTIPPATMRTGTVTGLEQRPARQGLQ
jgi:hypothetical protein